MWRQEREPEAMLRLQARHLLLERAPGGQLAQAQGTRALL